MNLKNLLVLVILAFNLIIQGCGLGSSGGGEESKNTKGVEIGAHYYVWYPQNFTQGHLRSRLSPEQEPLLGHYSSNSPAVAAAHIKNASEYGIDFFTLDWWPSRPEQNEAIKNGFLNASNIADMKFCIFYETIDLGYDEELRTVVIDDAKKQKFVSDLKSIAKDYFSHPQYYKIDGKPVIFFYVTRALSGDFSSMFKEARFELQNMGYEVFFVGDEIYWISSHNSPDGPILNGEPDVGRIELFDSITAYNSYAPSYRHHSGYASTSSHLADTASLYERFKNFAPKARIIPGVLPGYNDRGHRLGIDNYAIARQYSKKENQGSLLREYLKQIAQPYMDNDLRMIVITSWNEWNEDTAIEPINPIAPGSGDDKSGAYTQGLEYGGTGFEALEEVRKFSDRFESN